MYGTEVRHRDGWRVMRPGGRPEGEEGEDGPFGLITMMIDDDDQFDGAAGRGCLA